MNNTKNFDLQLLTQLRMKIYNISLLSLVILSTLLVLIYDFSTQYDLGELLAIWLFFLITSVISLYFKTISFNLAIYILFGGLILVFAVMSHIHPSEFLLALGPVFLPVFALMFGRRTASLLLLLTFYIILSSPLGYMADVELIPYLIINLLALLISVITVEGFYDLLTVMQDYQSYALTQMKEARESRAILASHSKHLATSTERLSYANRQLRIANRKIGEAHKLKAQFAANVSHELRTPINLVVGFAETIMRFPNVYGGRTLPSEYLSDIRTIYRNAKHLQNLINDILDISQIESGHVAMIKENLTIDIVIYEAVDLLRDQIENKNLNLEIDIPQNLSNLWLDRVRIRQVFINLLANAIRFTDTGYISIRAFEDNNHLMICVSDTGIGIEQGEEDNIFEEFYQSNNVNHRGEGSGLGLTLCRRFVQLHGGEIWVERKDIGSAFWIKLPTDIQSSLAKTGEIRSLSVEKNNIIVLSNDAKIVEFFERHCNRQSIISIQHFEAIESYLDINPIALVMDKDDYQKLDDDPLLRTVASRMSIITCSMPSGKRYMKSLGVEDYLIKPVSADMLESSIHQLSTLPQHILIVDDEREVVRLFARLLKAIVPDCHLTMAYSGQEALALLESLRPDLVLLDIIMPDVDGLTVLELMKSKPELKQIPVVIASAKGASEAISPSVDGELIVQKPGGFQPLQLIHCIETLVDYLNPLS